MGRWEGGGCLFDVNLSMTSWTPTTVNNILFFIWYSFYFMIFLLIFFFFFIRKRGFVLSTIDNKRMRCVWCE